MVLGGEPVGDPPHLVELRAPRARPHRGGQGRLGGAAIPAGPRRPRPLGALPAEPLRACSIRVSRPSASRAPGEHHDWRCPTMRTRRPTNTRSVEGPIRASPGRSRAGCRRSQPGVQTGVGRRGRPLTGASSAPRPRQQGRPRSIAIELETEGRRASLPSWPTERLTGGSSSTIRSMKRAARRRGSSPGDRVSTDQRMIDGRVVRAKPVFEVELRRLLLPHLVDGPSNKRPVVVSNRQAANEVCIIGDIELDGATRCPQRVAAPLTSAGGLQER